MGSEAKKSKELRFTYQDAKGVLRAVVVQATHFQDDGKDSVQVVVSSDGSAPVDVQARKSAAATARVKTKSRM